MNNYANIYTGWVRPTVSKKRLRNGLETVEKWRETVKKRLHTRQLRNKNKNDTYQLITSYKIKTSVICCASAGGSRHCKYTVEKRLGNGTLHVRRAKRIKIIQRRPKKTQALTALANPYRYMPKGGAFPLHSCVMSWHVTPPQQQQLFRSRPRPCSTNFASGCRYWQLGPPRNGGSNGA